MVGTRCPCRVDCALVQLVPMVDPEASTHVAQLGIGQIGLGQVPDGEI